ncbi:MAG: PIG-L family deacetylase [Patescibacteria group bacterium]
MEHSLSKLLKSDSNAWIIIAHPDDETIFCGGTMLSYPFVSWNVICVTMQMRTVRPKEFKDAMEMYKKFGVNIESCLTLEKKDTGKRGDLLTLEDINDWKESLKKLGLKPDLVFTHNKEGDYGHDHHKNINLIVHALFSNVLDFAYPGDKVIKRFSSNNKLYLVSLTKEILAKKNKIMNSCYKSQSDIWSSRLRFMMDFYFNKRMESFISD